MIPSREAPFKHEDLPRTASESRQFDNWLLDVTRRPYQTTGIDRALLDDGRAGVGPVRTTASWSIAQGIPVQHGMVQKIAYQDDQKILFVRPQTPSLLPVDGVWLPADALERDDA